MRSARFFLLIARYRQICPSRARSHESEKVADQSRFAPLRRRLVHHAARALPPAAPSTALHTTNAALPMTPSSPRPPGTPSRLAANANGTQASEISGTIGATRGDGPRTAPRSAAAPMTPAPHAVAFECCTVAVLESGERRCTLVQSFRACSRRSRRRPALRAFRHCSPIRARRAPPAGLVRPGVGSRDGPRAGAGPSLPRARNFPEIVRSALREIALSGTVERVDELAQRFRPMAEHRPAVSDQHRLDVRQCREALRRGPRRVRIGELRVG